ncbi:beta-ketoacyl synthase N-terminal-like domain-containing protein [Paenibacillus sp. J2TS4]|uniref:beta-ketoacyl synthase N-terminal-like domain-containing protein n=1 Tax=Paenibacillus sp. J2TS4 TaxID=2807194 RepID=UPI001B1D12AE|nr:beta-ketoacyl synthase N-terminal-like domain-containing protein [Paenibacillus sp. J2TS4]GIP35037.1 3-oxoacyl-[acyl-carrier-protein] synthase 2 [Paenibacillus sp. J2TS4]
MDRIVITGYGLKAPGVGDKEEYRNVLEKGVCTQKVVSGLGPHDEDIVCGIISEEAIPLSDRKYRYYPRVARMAIAASDEAVAMARLSEDERRHAAIVMGTSVGGLKEIEAYALISGNRQYRKFPISGAGAGNSHSITSALSYHLGVKGQAFTLSTGCTAGVDAMLMGKLLLESGQCEACLVGGSDAPITIGSVYSFMRLGALSRGTDIARAGVPFSLSSEGFVVSEAAAVLVMELESHARRRGARIYGELTGIYSNNDGLSIFESDSTGRNMITAMSRAVGEIRPTFVNSQALGMQSNDQVEAITHRALFGSSVPITSIKGNIGHSFASIGNLQVISALLSIEYGFIPPTIKTDANGFEDLPIVSSVRYECVDHVAITTHGYGGNNTCLLLSKSRGSG